MTNLHSNNGDETNVDVYDGYPLVQSLLEYDKIRTASLNDEGKNQINYPKSSDGWIPSVFMIRGRALDWMIIPWFIVVSHATIYTIIQELYFDDRNRDTDTWEIFFRFVFSYSNLVDQRQQSIVC